MSAAEERAYDIPLHDYMGLQVESRVPVSKVTVPLTHAIRGGVAPVHGGILATLVDVACACALGQDWDPSVEIPVSTELQVRFLAQPKESPMVAEAQVTRRARRVISVDCLVRDGAGSEVARGTGKYAIVRGFGELADGPPSWMTGGEPSR